MKITTVTYQKTYSIGPYLTERIGFEAQPEGNPGDAPMEMLSMLEELADEWHKKAHPHLYQETTDLNKKWVHPASEHMQQAQSGPTTLPTISQQTEPETDNLTAIQNAATLEDLKSFKLLAAADKTLYAAYCQRIKELTP